MKDFLGNYINVGDEVIYLKLLRTGSSSKRKIMFKGKVLNFKGQKVEVSREYTNEWNIEHPGSDLIFPKDVVVLKEKEIKTICGYPIEDVIKILSVIDIERKYDIKFTMDNLQKFIGLYQEEQTKMLKEALSG